MRWGVAGYRDVATRRVLPALRELARVDAVYVATPVIGHAPLALAAVRAGRHVLTEQPLAGALAHASGVAELAGSAGQHGTCAGVAYYRRRASAVRRLREIVSTSTVVAAEVRFRRHFDPGPDDPKAWRLDPAVSGGGVLADTGSHRLDLLCWLLGRPLLVSARLARRSSAEAELSATLVVRWPSGVRADCRANPHSALIADFVRHAASGCPPACPVTDAALVEDLIAAAGLSAARGGRPCPLPAHSGPAHVA